MSGSAGFQDRDVAAAAAAAAPAAAAVPAAPEAAALLEALNAVMTASHQVRTAAQQLARDLHQDAQMRAQDAAQQFASLQEAADVASEAKEAADAHVLSKEAAEMAAMAEADAARAAAAAAAGAVAAADEAARKADGMVRATMEEADKSAARFAQVNEMLGMDEEPMLGHGALMGLFEDAMDDQGGSDIGDGADDAGEMHMRDVDDGWQLPGLRRAARRAVRVPIRYDEVQAQANAFDRAAAGRKRSRYAARICAPMGHSQAPSARK